MVIQTIFADTALTMKCIRGFTKTCMIFPPDLDRKVSHGSRDWKDVIQWLFYDRLLFAGAEERACRTRSGEGIGWMGGGKRREQLYSHYVGRDIGTL